MLTRSKKMAEIIEIKQILEEIKTDLKKKATNDKIDELLAKIEEKDVLITALELRIEILEAKVSTQENTNKLLERKIDDNESYHRRLCLRISGIPDSGDARETDEDVLNKVKIEVDKLGINIPNYSFDRAHRIGKKKAPSDGTTYVRPVCSIYFVDCSNFGL